MGHDVVCCRKKKQSMKLTWFGGYAVTCMPRIASRPVKTAVYFYIIDITHHGSLISKYWIQGGSET